MQITLDVNGLLSLMEKKILTVEEVKRIILVNFDPLSLPLQKNRE